MILKKTRLQKIKKFTCQVTDLKKMRNAITQAVKTKVFVSK